MMKKRHLSPKTHGLTTIDSTHLAHPDSLAQAQLKCRRHPAFPSQNREVANNDQYSRNLSVYI